MPGSPFDFFEKHEYEHGFCECYRDPVACLVTYFLPCVAVGHTTGKIDGAGFNLWSCLCAPIGAYRNRRNIQNKNGIKETEDGSMCAVGCCICCAVTQDMHEVTKGEKKAEATQPEAAEAPKKEAAAEKKEDEASTSAKK